MVCRMNLRQSASSRTVPAPAKLNLLLDVLGRQVDGYHELETLMVPLRFWDSLSFTPTHSVATGQPGEISLEITHAQSRPICHQSSCEHPDRSRKPGYSCAGRPSRTRRLRSRRRRPLVKRIPAAAGLGGGSSDAAAALHLGNHGWDLGLSHAQLSRIASGLGSDVPFFLSSGTAICRGRGERVEPVPSTPALQCGDC